MTSKKSFFNLILNGLRNNLWSIACSFVILFLSMPIYGAITISVLKNRVLNNSIKAARLIDYYTKGVLGESNDLVKYAVVLLAVIIAFNSFSYIFSKQKVDLYHSIPIKRTTLFLSNYIVGIISFTVPYVITMIILAVVSRANSLLSAYGVLIMVITLFINLIGFIGVYTVSILSIMLTGRIVVAILANLTLFVYGPLIYFLSEQLHNMFFYTYSSYNTDKTNILCSMSIVNAFLNLSDGMDSYSRTLGLHPVNILIFVAATIIITVVDIVIYKTRKSEAAGESIAFNITMPVISLALLIPASLFGGMMFNSFVSNAEKSVNYGWFIFGALFTIVILHFIIQAIYYCDFKSMFKNPAYPLISALMAAFIIILFAFDLIRYDNLSIKDGKFESIAISSFNLSGNQDYFNYDSSEDYFGNNYMWILEEKHRFEKMKINDKELIKELLTAGIKNKKCMTDYEKPYNYYCDFSVQLNLSNGKHIYRNYRIPSEENLALLEKIYTNEEYKKGVFSIFDLDDEMLTQFSFANAVGKTGDIKDTDIKEIIASYKEELLSQDGKELESDIPLGYIYKDYVYSDDYYSTDFQLHRCYIYPSFTKTIALIEKAGINLKAYTENENVSKIAVTDYSYNDTYGKAVVDYASDNNQRFYSDENAIRTIYEKAYPSSMADANGAIFERANLGIDIYFYNMPNQEEYPISYIFHKDAIPEIVRNDFKTN